MHPVERTAFSQIVSFQSVDLFMEINLNCLGHECSSHHDFAAVHYTTWIDSMTVTQGHQRES